MDSIGEESDTEVVAVKVPFESRETQQCLPCVGTDNFKEKDAVNQMRAKVKAYRRELGELGLVRPEFFDLMNKAIVVPKKSKWTTDGTSFVCAHNICGNFDPNDCIDYQNCCHHTFSLKLDSSIPTPALLHSFFSRLRLVLALNCLRQSR